MNIVQEIIMRASSLSLSGSQKSMADLHPDLMEREHVVSIRSDAVMAAAPYSYLSALGDYQTHVWVRKAINVIANSIAPLPLKILRKDTELTTHPFLDLLNYVNPIMSPADLWGQWVVDMMLGGEEGWEFTKTGAGKFGEIFPRQPHTISIVPERGRERYYQVSGYRIDDGSGQNVYELPPSEFLLFKFYNPRNPWRGLAPISAIRMAIAIDQFAQAWSRLFFSKGARPDYAVITPEGVTESEREELEKKLATKFGGAENWFKPVVLEQGVTDIKPLDFKPRDLEWVAQRELSRDEIGAIFGVPDEIMGYGRDTYENFETAHWVLWSLTILPLCGMRDVTLTRWAQGNGLLAEGETVATDISQVVALKKNLKDLIGIVKEIWMMGGTFNEASAAVGLGITIEGGDVAYLPSGIQLAETVINPPPPPPQLAPAPVAEDNIDVPEPEDEEADAPTPEEQAEEKPKRSRKGIPYGSPAHGIAFAKHEEKLTEHERRLGRVVARLLREQQTEVLEDLKQSKTFGEIPVIGGVWGKSPQSVANNPFDMDKWMQTFRETVRPILLDVIVDAGTAALIDVAGDVAFDVDNPTVTEFLALRNQRFAQRVNETTWNQLKASLTEALNNGESLLQMQERVDNVMGDRIRSSKETIARTEVNGALNGGTIEGWRQSDVVEEKEWLSTLDDRTRGNDPRDTFDHVAAHGERVGLEEFFVQTGEPLEFPGADGSAANVINCRCSMTAVIDVKRRKEKYGDVKSRSNGHAVSITGKGRNGSL